MNVSETVAAIDRDGFTILRNACSAELVESLRASLPPVEGAGLRGLRMKQPIVDKVFLQPAIESTITAVLGDRYRCVRSILFDKRPGSNWLVPPHRDMTICVEKRIETAGFGPWSVKDGIPHVQPPDDILDRMLTIRLHLDKTTSDSGALRVWPGSHAKPDQDWDRAESVLCEAEAGDVLLMRPRIVHASSKSTLERPRRIVHLELAADELPNGLCWYESA